MKYVNSILIKSIVLSFLLFSISSCGETNDIEVRDYQLVWEDNFEGAAGESPDASKWVYDLGRGPNGDGWGNQELQIYTANPENVSLDGNGNLAITVKSQGTFTSARITTEGQFDQAFGRIEARMKLPYGPGIHPAFWMLGADFSQIGWPECGEIDIMELKGQEPNIVHGSLHGPGYSAGNSVSKTYGLANARFDTDFYVFAIQWGPDFIEWYVDDKIYQRVTPDDVPGEWVFDHPFFMLLNVAVGGTFVGFPSEGTIYPQTMLVDYVKVYKEVNP